MDPKYNYQNNGVLNQGVAQNGYGSFNQTPNTLMGTNNKGALSGLAGTAAQSGMMALLGGPMGMASGILNLLPAIFQSVQGGRQLSEAKKLESQNPRPQAEVAPAINQMVGYNYGQTLNQDIPGGEIARNEIKGATASGMNAASQLGSGSEAYGMLGQLVGREQNQFSNLAQMTAQDVAGKQRTYANSLGELAQEQNRVWDWNKAQPYLQAAQMASQLRDSGMKNLYSGVANVSGSAAETLSPTFNSALDSGTGYGGNKKQPPVEEVMKMVQQYLATKK